MWYQGQQHSLTGAANAAAMAGASACLALRFDGAILWALTGALAVATTAIAWRPASEDIRRPALPWGLAASVAVAGMALLPWGYLPGAVALGGLAFILYAIGAAIHVRELAREEREQQKAPARAGG